jgi:hypothetical protein
MNLPALYKSKLTQLHLIEHELIGMEQAAQKENERLYRSSEYRQAIALYNQLLIQCADLDRAIAQP